jgi:hypothetical protein
MPLSRARATLLSLLALLLVGSFAASSAYAEGPYWHVREGKNAAKKLTGEEGPMGQGTGGEQILTSSIGGEKIEIAAPEQQIKIQIFNRPSQAQIKIRLVYHNPKLVKPVVKGECEVKIGENNEVVSFGHVGWKWNGTTKQLEEPPKKEQKLDLVVTAKELSEEATELPKETFTTITLKGAGCGVLTGKFPVNGSLVVEPKPPNLEEFSNEIGSKYSAEVLEQHLFNAKTGKNFGVKTGLFLGTEPALLKGEDKFKFDLTIGKSEVVEAELLEN